MQLGEAMVKDGLITGETLTRAIERQVLFGGRLGSNLVEMGAVSWEELAQFLGKFLGVPYAGPEQFEDVPEEALNALPAEMARKYSVFPIKKERSRLHIAMKYPDDIGAMDDIRFITGLDVKSWVAPEIRIFYSIKKYYGDAPSEEPEAARDEESEPPSKAVRPEYAPVRPAPEIADAADEAAPSPEAVSEPAPEPVIEPAVARPDNPYERLASPSSMEDIAEATVAAAKSSLVRAAMFIVRDGAAACWNASGFGADTPEINIALDAPSIFKDVVEDKVSYKGPVLPVPRNMPLIEALGGGPPLEAVACPLIIRGKAVGVLYGDGGAGEMLKTDARWFDELMAKASASLEILILKSKILSRE